MGQDVDISHDSVSDTVHTAVRLQLIRYEAVFIQQWNHSFHREEKVTFTYDNGRGRIIKNYDLSFSSNEYFYNQLVKHHRYYVPNGWLILIIILSLIASLTGFLISFEGLSYETYVSYSLEEIVGFRYAIVKQFMSFCGYDGIPKAKESGIYKTLNKRIPTYHSIYRYIKKYMETGGENPPQPTN